MSDITGGTNRLIEEKSPYLLQHAHNPVDWYPWGDEAFEKAVTEDRPIFLSIGYSTCHWCHVMERESFEDEDVAELMNQTFVCVKVDREERPDVDAVYMEAARVMTGTGGWPLTIVMTPDGRPFFAATYLPRTSRFGRPGMLELVPAIAEVWTSRRSEVLETAERIVAALKSTVALPEGPELDRGTMDEAFSQLAAAFDGEHGGFGTAPKFPTPHQLLFLLRHSRRTGERSALDMVERTLDSMRAGGIYDQIGLGFHRYSTDDKWLVPHFEKMLYDQALLAMAYTEGYLATGHERHARTAGEILDYVLRDLGDPAGGFYSAEDADSEGVEGRFYIWTLREFQDALGDEDARLAADVFGVTAEGDLPDEATGRGTGSNVLHLSGELETVAARWGVTEERLQARIESLRRRLFERRSSRVRPHLDDKVLTDWNGLTMAALSRAGLALDERRYTDAAVRCADFLMSTMRDGEGRLLHSYREGEAAIRAGADDYASLSMGLFELHQTTQDARFLRESARLMDEMLESFWDVERHGFFSTPDDGEKLLTRRKEAYDGAVPSSNSVALLNLLRLGRTLARPDLEEHAQALVRAFAGQVAFHPSAHTMFLCGLDYGLGPSAEVVIAGERGGSDTLAFLSLLHRRFAPDTVVVFRPTGDDSDVLALAPWVEPYLPVEGSAAAYVCRDRECRLPVTDPRELGRLLDASPGSSS